MTELLFDTRLVEEAVFLHMHAGAASDQGQRLWDEERERLYEGSAAGERDERFRAFGRRWFRRLGLDQPIREALEACPNLERRVERVEVRFAVRAKDERAELFVAPAPAAAAAAGVPEGGCETGRSPIRTAERDPPARAVLCLRPQRFGDPLALLRFASVELLRIDDMLAPSFHYRPELPRELEGHPGERERLQDRLRVLWEANLEARVAERLRLPTERDSPSGLARVFGGLGDEELEELRDWLRNEVDFRALLAAAKSGTCPDRRILGPRV